jgi:hypothetical protein
MLIEPLLLLLKASVVALVLGIGLGATPGDVAYLWRRPRLLLRSLDAMCLVLAAAGHALLAVEGRPLLALGWLPAVTLAALTLVALAIGHVLGGPDPADRAALAVACATRHVWLTYPIAAALPGVRALSEAREAVVDGPCWSPCQMTNSRERTRSPVIVGSGGNGPLWPISLGMSTLTSRMLRTGVLVRLLPSKPSTST